MARDGSKGGVYLDRAEIQQLTEGIGVSHNTIISRLGIPLEAHKDLLVEKLEDLHLRYWGPGQPFSNSGNSSHFHVDSRGRNKEKDRYGVSFYPNLALEETKNDRIKSGRPKIVVLDHGSGDVHNVSLDPSQMSDTQLNRMLSHSLFKVKDKQSGETRNLNKGDLIIREGTNEKTQAAWTTYSLSANIEYDKGSIEKIRREYGLDSRAARIENHAKQFTSNLPESKSRKRDFQKQVSMDMEAALVQQALYEQANPRDQEDKRFSVLKSNYLNRATKDTREYGIGNQHNIWESIYRRGSVLMAAELSEKEPLGNFFVETMAKGLEENTDNENKGGDNKTRAKNSYQNLKDNGATFLIFNKFDEQGNSQKVIQHIGSIKSPSQDNNISEKKFLSGGGGLDGHYIEVLGSVNPHDDVKPPKHIFVLEGIKTAVAFAGALDIQKETEANNSTVVLSAGSADNMIKVAASMAKLHENALIGIVADNDAKPKNLENPNPEDNKGLMSANKARKAVMHARREIGAHPNVVMVVPPALQDENGYKNTDIADICENMIQQGSNNIKAALAAASADNDGRGVKVDDATQLRAKQYMGDVYTQGFGRTITNAVNSALESAKKYNEVYNAPHFSPAPVVPVQNFDYVRPLPSTFGKKRSEVNPENTAFKARVSAQARELMQQTPAELKDVNAHMWSHRGFYQAFDKDGDMTHLEPASSKQKIASMVTLLNVTLDKGHPLHKSVKDIGLNAYIESDKHNIVDMKNSAYATMLFMHDKVSSTVSNPNTPEPNKAALKNAFVLAAIGALSPTALDANEVFDYMKGRARDANSNPNTNLSTSMLAVAQVVAKDIANNSITTKRGELPQLMVEDRVYKSSMEKLGQNISALSVDTLSSLSHEPKEHMLKSFEFSDKYSQILRTARINELERAAYGRLPDEERDKAVENGLREQQQSYRKYADTIQDKLLAGAESKGSDRDFWDKVKAQHPKTASSIQDLSKDMEVAEFASDTAASFVYKNAAAFNMPPANEETLRNAASMVHMLHDKLPVFTRDPKEAAGLANNEPLNEFKSSEVSKDVAEPTRVVQAPSEPEVQESSNSLGGP